MKKMWMTLAAVLCCSMTTMVFTGCSSDDDDKPTPADPADELADYTIIYYGQGGTSLDQQISDNINQFYEADAASYKKVNVAVQFKFSTAENLAENGMPEEYAEAMGSQTYRFVVDPELDVDEWMDDEYLYGAENCDCTNADSLTHFIDWAAKTCPAKNYILVLTDHGGSYMPHTDLPYTAPSRSIFEDDGRGKAGFSVFSLASAIRNASIRPQVIYMDACLMNTVEYQFELKELCDYYVASTFCVPGVGGDYTTLVNSLATENDIEKSLIALAESNTARWGDEEINMNVSALIFNDITITRTDKLDAFGVALGQFTQKLLNAYLSGKQEVADAIDDCTAFAFKVQETRPSYDLIDYVNEICKALPDVFPATLQKEVNDAFNATVVKAFCSETLAENGLTVELSVLLGFNNSYVIRGKALSEDGEITEAVKYFYADGSSLLLEPEYPSFRVEGNWGSTFDATFKQLAFDKAVGWSRWIEVNRQMPCEISPTEWDPEFFSEVLEEIDQ